MSTQDKHKQKMSNTGEHFHIFEASSYAGRVHRDAFIALPKKD